MIVNFFSVHYREEANGWDVNDERRRLFTIRRVAKSTEIKVQDQRYCNVGQDYPAPQTFASILTAMAWVTGQIMMERV